MRNCVLKNEVNVAADESGLSSPVKLPGKESHILGPGPVEEARKIFGAAGVHTGWADVGGEATTVAMSPVGVGGHKRSAAVLANSQSVVRPLERLVGAAASMMQVSTKHGFMSCRTILTGFLLTDVADSIVMLGGRRLHASL